MNLGPLVRQLMVEIHRISDELAAYHVADMSEADLEFSLQMYERLGLIKAAGAELSVAGPKFTAVDVLLPGCDARTDDGRPHGTQPCFRQGAMAKHEASQPMPDSGEINRVRSGSRARTESSGGTKKRRRCDAPGAIAECGVM